MIFSIIISAKKMKNSPGNIAFLAVAKFVGHTLQNRTLQFNAEIFLGFLKR